MLKIGSPGDIQGMFSKFEKEISIIIDNLIELSYFMRGATSYDSMLMSMSVGERDRIHKFIKTRLENESKSMHPVY